jgi:hypothetical protein
MTFTVEDGTGVAGANAYITETFFGDYHAERANDVSAVTVGTVRQAAIIKATDYVELRWGRAYRGGPRTLETQGLGWPREEAYDDDGFILEGVPSKLAQAVAEYALRAATAELAPDPVLDPALVGRRRKVGPIETEDTYRAGGATTTLKAYPKADRLMAALTRHGGGVVRG